MHVSVVALCECLVYPVSDESYNAFAEPSMGKPLTVLLPVHFQRYY